MWICFSDSFLSIVSKGCAPDELCVRARRKGDIERVFSGAVVSEVGGTDYQFRAFLKRDVVADVLAQHVHALDYSNFKNSVRDRRLHDAFADIWRIMVSLQVRRPFCL